MEVTKIREWLEEFKTLVQGSAFELQVVEGILYPYLNVQDETKYLKYITGEEFGSITDNLGNFLYCRFTDSPMRYQQNKLVEVDLVLVAGLPFCKNVGAFANLIVQQIQSKLVTVGDIEVQTNVIEVLKQEVSEDTKKFKSDMPLVSVAFTILVTQSNIVCQLDILDCGCTDSMLMSC